MARQRRQQQAKGYIIHKRIIIGDQEIKIPKLSLGVFPLIGTFLVLWLLTGIYVVGPDEVGVVQTLGKYSHVA